MEVIVLEKKNTYYVPFDTDNLDLYSHVESYQIDGSQKSMMDFIDERYDPLQTSHHYMPRESSPLHISPHLYSAIVPLSEPEKLWYIVTSQAYYFGKVKSWARTQIINEIIK